MINKKQVNLSSFQSAIAATVDIQNCFRNGLQALGNESKKVELADTKRCGGSVFIDDCLLKQKKHADANRWDYAFAYKEEVYFVEVHTASTHGVRTVLKKLQWLKDWLIKAAPELNKLRAKGKTPFYWIQSNGFHIPPQSPQSKEIVNRGLKPISKLKLS